MSNWFPSTASLSSRLRSPKPSTLRRRVRMPPFCFCAPARSTPAAASLAMRASATPGEPALEMHALRTSRTSRGSQFLPFLRLLEEKACLMLLLGRYWATSAARRCMSSSAIWSSAGVRNEGGCGGRESGAGAGGRRMPHSWDSWMMRLWRSLGVRAGMMVMRRRPAKAAASDEARRTRWRTRLDQVMEAADRWRTAQWRMRI